MSSSPDSTMVVADRLEGSSLLQKWTREALRGLGAEGLDRVLRGLAQSLSIGRLLLGRGLLELERGGHEERFGCSGAVHYGIVYLGLAAWEAREVRRVALVADDLPLITAAVEAGQVGWGKLRIVTRVATPDTDEYWSRLAPKRSCRQLEKLVRRCPRGGLPGDPISTEELRDRMIEMRMTCSPDDEELFQLGCVLLSQEVGRPVSLLEAMRYLFSELALGDRPVDSDRFHRVMAALGRTEREQREIEDARAAGTHVEPEAGGAATHVERGPEAVAEATHVERGPEPVAAGTHVEHGADTYTLPVVRGADAVHEQELPYHVAPWEAVAAVEEPCPGAPDLLLARPARVPHWELVPDLQRGEGVLQRPRTRFNPEAQRVTPAQRRQIMRRDGFRCAVPDCPNRIWLHVHHIVWLCLGGLTIPPNLLMCCSSCHANIHAGRLFVEGDAEVAVTFRDREGRVFGAIDPETAARSARFAEEFLRRVRRT